MRLKLTSMLLILAFSITQTANLISFEKYQIINLDLKKYESSHVTSFNDNGWITGTLIDGGSRYIFVLDENKNVATRWERMDTPIPYINNSNEVFGSFINRTSDSNWYYDEELVYKWENPFNFFQFFNFHHLGHPRWHASTAFNFNSNLVWDVNDLGQVLVMNHVTKAHATDELNTNSVWVYDDKLPNEATWIQDNFHKIEDPNFTAGYKINNLSQILGSTVTGSKIYKNRTHHVSIYHFKDKTLQILDFPHNSWGNDLNDSGQVAGYFYDPNEDMFKGFLTAPSGQITEISNFLPSLISNQGELYGTYIYGKKKNELAAWKDGEIVDFKELVTMVDDQGNEWDSIEEIVDANNNGYLIGNGTIRGVKHGFLLKPVSD